MIFLERMSVDSGKTAADPEWEKLVIIKGEIQEWVIFMPSQCADLTKFRIEYHGAPIFPSVAGSWAYAFFEPTVIRSGEKINTPPYELDFYGINSDTAQSHEYLVYVNMKPEKMEAVTEGEEGLWERLKGYIGVD